MKREELEAIFRRNAFEKMSVFVHDHFKKDYPRLHEAIISSMQEVESKSIKRITTDDLLKEIISYKYKSYGAPFVFLDYNPDCEKWSVTFRNPVEFNNDHIERGISPTGACENVLKFIKENPDKFTLLE